jgi:O-antigen/teichoic acid export membrane protein
LIWDNFKKNKALIGLSTIGFGNIIGGAISSIFWLVLAGMLDTESYGQLSYFLAIMGVFSVVAMVGGQYTMQVYTSKGLKIEATLYLVSTISSLIVGLILYFIFNDIGLTLLIISVSLLNFYFAELIGKKLFSKYSLMIILQKILFVIFSLSLYYVIGLEGILIGYALSNFIFIKHVYNIFKKEKFNLTFLIEKKKIIFSNYLTELTATARNHIDEILTVPLFGLMFLGNYFLAIQIITLMNIIPGIVIKYTIGEDSRGISTSKIKYITIITSFLLAIIGALILPTILPIFFPQFTETVLLIPILCFAIIPRTIFVMLMSSFLAKEKNLHNVIGNIVTISLLVVGISISYLFYGEIGVAYSYLIGTSGGAIYLLIISFILKRNTMKI